jgi:G3E family GTPase
MLPAIVIGGWLGAGKTTLVNRLLRDPGGRRIAVMVNDFGDIGIDADLIVSQDDQVMNLAGGCVCCAVGSDLVEALMALPGRTPAFDLVLIETSGVALPGAVARAVRLVPGIEVDGVVVLADAETVRARAVDRYVGDTVLRQLEEADLLVLNKIDLVAADTLDALRGWLDGAAPRAVRIEATDAQIPPQVVLGLADADATARAPVRDGTGLFTGDLGARRSRPAAQLFESASFEIGGPIDVAALGAALADPALGLIRAKGAMHDLGGERRVVQAVGARIRIHPAPAGSRAAHGDATGRLVAIGLRGSLDAAAIEARITSALRS